MEVLRGRGDTVSRFFSLAIGALCVLCLELLSACNSEKEPWEEKPERNIIKEYVNTPKNKAFDVKDKLEAAQEKVRNQSRDLDE